MKWLFLPEHRKGWRKERGGSALSPDYRMLAADGDIEDVQGVSGTQRSLNLDVFEQVLLGGELLEDLIPGAY
jgi:hypothetical protein